MKMKHSLAWGLGLKACLLLMHFRLKNKTRRLNNGSNLHLPTWIQFKITSNNLLRSLQVLINLISVSMLEKMELLGPMLTGLSKLELKDAYHSRSKTQMLFQIKMLLRR